MFFSGHETLGSSVADGPIASSGIEADIDSFRALLPTLLSGRSFFSPGVAGWAEGAVAVDLKSKAVPGVLGVFVAEPKEAKAPDPSPKAEEPPVVGEAKALGVNGAMPLNGFLLPCDESPPVRFAAENVRWWGGSCFSAGSSAFDVDSESLLVLELLTTARYAGNGAYLERRVQRFSLFSIGGRAKVCSDCLICPSSEIRRMFGRQGTDFTRGGPTGNGAAGDAVYFAMNDLVELFFLDIIRVVSSWSIQEVIGRRSKMCGMQWWIVSWCVFKKTFERLAADARVALSSARHPRLFCLGGLRAVIFSRASTSRFSFNIGLLRK